ncbi:MAG: acylphosphatase [Gemmataceae bacterium]|jgi:acylphosphatase|nr:MAG: acylphosphatase [Gemmataceae bacterium]
MARMLYFHGRVQGVGFRATAAGLARRYGVQGWVRNLADGRVQLWVQGSEESVEQFLSHLRQVMRGYIEGEESYAVADEAMEGFRIVP